MLDLVDCDNLKHGTRYPDTVKEIAFQIWCYLADRNGAEVSRMLRSGEHCDAVEVPRETINYWSREHGWAERASADMASILPDAQNQTIAGLVLSARSGMAYLRRVNDGLENGPDVEDIVKRDDLDQSEKKLLIEARIRAHAAARKDRIVAALGTIDRAGLHPSGKNNPLVFALHPPRKPAVDIHTMTDDELDQRERDRGAA